MSRRLKIILISILVVFGLLLSTMVIVPWQVKKQGRRWIAENTDRSLTIEKVYFNPFTLTAEISGMKLTEQSNDQPFVAFKRLMFSISPKSIIKQALIFSRIELDDFFVNIELLGQEDFNFSDFTRLGGNDSEAEVVEDKDPLYFSLNNIVLTNGSINFTNQTSLDKTQYQIRKLELSIPVIGNIPYLVENYVEPKLSMLLNGAIVRVSGETKPFKDTRETKLFLTLDGADLAYYAQHSPIPLPLEVKEGTLDFEINLSYLVSKRAEPKLLLDGELALSDIDLWELNGRELFRLSTLILDIDQIDFFAQDFNLSSLEIYDPQVYVDRDSSGGWNFQQILPPQKIAESGSEAVIAADEKGENLPLLTIGKLALIDGQIHYRDDFVPGGVAEEISSINLELNHLSTHQGKKTAATLKLQTERNLTVEINGELGLNPVTADLQLTADALQLKPYYPYLEGVLTAPIEGFLNLTGELIYTEAGNLLVRQGGVELNELLIPFTADDQMTLARFSISDSSFDLQQQQIDLGTIQLSSGAVKATRLADGSLSPLQLLREQPKEEKTEAEFGTAPGKPWKIHAAKVDLQKIKLLLTDASLAKKPQVKISELNFRVENLNYPVAKKSPFSLEAKVGKRGDIKVAGTVVHTPLKLQAQADISAFSLPLLNDFFPEEVRISLKSGKLYSKLAINLQQLSEKLCGDFSGKLHVSNFDLRDPVGHDELLTWGNLNLAGIKGELAPFSLRIKDVVLSDYAANIQITSDGQVNLARIAVAEDKAADTVTGSQSGKGEKTVVKEKSEPTEAPADVQIGTLVLQGGTVSFVDRHLKKIFSTTMYDLGGRITGLSSAEEMRAKVDLRGQLENHSLLTINGEINPLSQDLFADLTISFKDIDLTPLTPYSGTYLGYVIDRGKLYLDLNYHIEKQQVKATNQVMIDQFTLGKTVKSDQATSLPVAFAISLLKDNAGEIHLDIPVSGDLNDPAFSVGGVIFTVLKNLLVKAATSPFSLLSSMLGGGEDFSGITFVSGRATIAAEQLTKLKTLVKMLVQRPALILEISGFVDKEKDQEGYRQERFRQMLVHAKKEKLADDGDSPATKGEITVSAEEYPEILLRVYKQADFPRPENFIGILKKLPDAEMEKLILANIIVEDEQLQDLAKARVMAVRDALVVDDEKIKPRLFLKKADIYQLPKEGPASRVEFDITAK